MTASFLITVERLPARPAALAIYADTIFPVWQPVRVGLSSNSWKIGLPRLFQILSDGPFFLLRASPFGQGVGGTGDRDFLPAYPGSALCRHPIPRTAFLNSLGLLAPGLSSRVHDANQARGIFRILFRPLLWLLVGHVDEHDPKERQGVGRVRQEKVDE